MSARRVGLAAAALGACALLGACAEGEVGVDDIRVGDALADDGPSPDDGAPSDTAPSDVGDVGDAGRPDAGDASGDAGLDAALPDAGALGDGLPTDAVMFFTTRCPAGWTPFTEAAGRVAVPTIGDAPGGTQRGTPLASGEDRGHTHALALAFSLGAVSYVGAPGGLNEGVGTSGSVAVETTTAAASTGLPYVQLLVCRKTTAAVRRGVALPPGMLMFFAGARCPAGFSQPAVTQGRLPVAAPPGAINGATFGGAPLGPADAPTHAHDVSATLATSSHGIALASGCCARDYARNDRYTASRPTAAAEPLVPTIQLLQCQKD